MYPPSPWRKPVASFGDATPLLATEPASGPLCALYVPEAWMPYLLGAAQQLCQPAVWDTTDQAALSLALDRAADLVLNLGIACLAPPRNPQPLGNGGSPLELIQNSPGGPFVMNG